MPKSSGTDFFLRPGEPHHLRKGVLEGRSPPRRFVGRSASESLARSPARPASESFDFSSPGSNSNILSSPARSMTASTAAPRTPERERGADSVRPSPVPQRTDFGSFDLACLGGTIESLAAATEAAALNAKVCLVEPSAGVDNRAVFRLALRSCLRKQLGVGVAETVPATFEHLRREREVYLERLSSTRKDLVKQGVIVLTCSTASFQAGKHDSSCTPNGSSKARKPLRSSSSTLSRDNQSQSPRPAKDGVAYTPRYGVRHQASTRGHRGTWWSSFPPEAPHEEKPVERSGLHLLLENAAAARIGSVSAAHYLIAAGERSLLHRNNDRLEGRDFCTQPEDLLEGLPQEGPVRLCIIGSNWMAVELCAFCELAGAEVTWFLEQVDSRVGEDHLVEMLPRLAQQVKARGKTKVHTDFSSRFVRVVQRGATEAKKLLYVQAKHSGAECCGPFDMVLLFGKSDPVMLGVDQLPGVALGKDGRLLVEPNGAAGPAVSAIGEVASQKLTKAKGKADARNPSGLIAFGNDEQGLLSQGRYFAKMLFGATDAKSLVAPALRTTTALSYPPVGLVGMSGDEARTVFPAPEWSVTVSFSRHQLSGGIFGHFVVGLTCVQRNAPRAEADDEEQKSPFVVGAALIAESGGLPLISGLLLGFAVAVESKVQLQSFDRILAAYPLVDHMT